MRDRLRVMVFHEGPWPDEEFDVTSVHVHDGAGDVNFIFRNGRIEVDLVASQHAKYAGLPYGIESVWIEGA